MDQILDVSRTQERDRRLPEDPPIIRQGADLDKKVGENAEAPAPWIAATRTTSCRSPFLVVMIALWIALAVGNG